MPDTTAYQHDHKMDGARPRGLSVINAGLMRTGTMSMARAYDILGLRAHHGLDMSSMPGDEGGRQWALMEKAAEGTWPGVPRVRPGARRFTREDWDQVFGDYDAVSDVGSFFAEQLIQAYPEARVVVVQRDFDTWWESFQPQVADGLLGAAGLAILPIMARLAQHRGGEAMQKTLMGFFDANNLAELKANARKAYFGYYDRIRRMVPPERMLEYRLGDGWEPLCAFLGKEVPGVPFPRLNDRVAHRAAQMRELRHFLGMAWLNMRPWVVGALLVCIAIGFVRR